VNLNLNRLSRDYIVRADQLSANPATSDEVLIGRIANGDRLAMQVLFARHHVRVFRFVLRLVRDEAAAEDLISEVFLDVWRQAGKFEGRAAVSTWLLAIARFKALSALRRRPEQGWTRKRLRRSRIRLIPPTSPWRRRTRAKFCGSAWAG
jgi:RNA polymerase sigma-70 factor, ECF subfamily